ncbi:MAG: ribosomal protein S18-alanine N-acetyltransferase [Candidatus Asgardarchaeia archaeon]
MFIRQVRESDVYDIFEIERLCFKDPYSFHFLSELIKNYSNFSFVAEENNRLIGFIISRIEWDGRGHILSIAVHPSYQGRGVGTRLLITAINTLFSFVDEIFLEVRISNERAIRLYRNIGFEIKSSINNYYPDGESAFIMVLKKSDYPYKYLLDELY